MYDLLKVSDGLIGHGDGFVNVNGMISISCCVALRLTCIKVEFRLIVFRPFKGEIITARISSCTEQGIRRTAALHSNKLCLSIADKDMFIVSMNFFSDIHVPTSLLFEGTEL